MSFEFEKLGAKLLIVVAFGIRWRVFQPTRNDLFEFFEVTVNEQLGHLSGHRVMRGHGSCPRPLTNVSYRGIGKHVLMLSTQKLRAVWMLSAMATLVGSVGGCKRGSSESGDAGTAEMEVRPSSSAVMSAESDEPVVPKTKRPPKQSLMAGQKIEITAGSFTAGSTPGDRGRDPGLEPALEQVELGPYAIDRLPYPNDPNVEPKTDVTRKEAKQLCEEQGKRLCTELEWERACKGPDNDPYSTGEGWDPACEVESMGCASGFDVVSMGGSLREWTSSNFEPLEEGERTLAVVRGSRAKVADTEHRCARREMLDPGAHGPDIGFRCCSGAPNAAKIPRPKPVQTFRRVKLDPEQISAMIGSVPQLKGLGDVSFFSEPDDVTRVLARGDAGKKGNILTTSPLMWSPALGEEILVLAGLGSSGSSFVAAFHRLPGDRYRLASSFVLKNEKGPIVLAFNGWVKNRLHWSTCWGCLGEEGAVYYRKSRRVVIEQR